MSINSLTDLLNNFWQENQDLAQFCQENNLWPQVNDCFEQALTGKISKTQALRQIQALLEQNEAKNLGEKPTLIVGNGDINSLSQARTAVAEHGVNGVMIGRGIFKNPWLFNELFGEESKTLQQRVDLLLFHLQLWEKTWILDGESRPEMSKNYQLLKKYFKIYIQDFAGAAELRARLMETENLLQARTILLDFLSKNN